jgi:RNA polymerase sigma factor (sigma-70 family)
MSEIFPSVSLIGGTYTVAGQFGLQPGGDAVSDAAELDRFVRERSDEAFRVLVEKYTNMVYATCLRGLGGDHSAAEEAVQSVFALLARKAGGIRRPGALAAWLFKTANWVVVSAKREAARRGRREAEAALRMEGVRRMAKESAGRAFDQEEQALLNDAIAALRTKQRDAIVMHFLHGRSRREVAAALGCSEDALRMRIDYGLKKLRSHFARKGIVLSLGVLTAGLTIEGTTSASAGLTALCCAAGRGATSIYVNTVAKGALKMMFWAKVKAVAFVVSGVLVLGAAGGAAVQQTFAADAKEGSTRIEIKAEGNTIDEWLQIVEQQQADYDKLPKDPVLEEIQRGCVVTYFRIAGGIPITMPKEAKQKLVNAYKTWLAGDGKALIEKWLDGEALTDEEQNYLGLVKMTCVVLPSAKEIKDFPELQKKCKKYAGKLSARIDRIFLKGNFEKCLTAEDIEYIRLYRMRQQVLTHNKGPGPVQVAITDKDIEQDTYGDRYASGKKIEQSPFDEGTTMPDFRVMRVEHAVLEESYTDDPFDMLRAFKPIGIVNMLNIMNGYDVKSDEKTGKKYMKGRKPLPAGDDEHKYIRLSTFNGKKPVLCFPGNMNEASHAQISEGMEVMHRLYGDRVAMFHVQTDLWDGHTGVYRFYPPHAGQSEHMPQMVSTMMDRARYSKSSCMRRPDMTLPFCMDTKENFFMNAYRTPGHHQTAYLLDISGKVAAHDPWPFTQFKFWMGNYAEGDVPVYVNYLEREVITVLKNSGKYVKGRDIGQHFGVKITNIKLYSLVEGAKNFSTALGGTVVAVNEKDNTVTMESAVNFHRFVKTKKLVMTLDKDVDLFRGGFRFKMSRAGYFMLGDYFKKLTFWRMPDGTFRLKQLSQMSSKAAPRPLFDEIDRCIEQRNNAHFGNMWVFGKIKSVSADGTRLVMVRDKLNVKAMTGYNFIQTDRSKILLPTSGNAVRGQASVVDKVAQLDKWVKQDQADDESLRAYSFQIDKWVRISLNGDIVPVTDLKPDDRIAVKLDITKDGQKSFPRYIHAARLPENTK